MPKLYTTGNYIIADDGTNKTPYARNDSKYTEDTDGYTIGNTIDIGLPSTFIAKADVTTWETTDGGGTFYTESTLRTFLRENTAVGETDTTGKEDKSNKVSDFTTINEVLYPNTFAVQGYISQSLSGLTAYFFHKEVSPIEPTYWQMKSAIAIHPLETISTASIVDNQVLATFITNTGFPNTSFLPSGILKVAIAAEKTVGTKNTQLYAKLYKRDLATLETLICTTTASVVIPLSEPVALYQFDGIIPDGIMLNVTDLLMVEIIASVTGTGSSPTIILNVEDDTTSRVELPSSAIGYTPEDIDNKQDNLNVDGTGAKYPTVDAINEFTITLNLLDVLTETIYLPFDYIINSITDLVNSPTTYIEDDGIAYVLGEDIVYASEIEVTVDVAAVIVLNCTVIEIVS